MTTVNQITALDVSKEVVVLNKEITHLTLIRHGVSINWRQKYNSNPERIKNFERALIQEEPIETRVINREDFIHITLDNLTIPYPNQVWSLTSAVKVIGGDIMHLSMMNFHPFDGVTLDDIASFIRITIPGQKGFLLDSGRYYHYYGCNLLTKTQWINFNAKFLMPCILVSPRYIGHRLQDGYSTLRLTNDENYKSQIPFVVSRIA